MRSARAIVLAALAAAAVVAPCLRADDARAIDALNAPAKVIQEKSKSWKTVFDAYVAMTAPPMAVGPEFGALTTWPA